MRAAFLVYADRAVGFVAASVGVAFLVATVRLLAPMAPVRPTGTFVSSAFVARAPASVPRIAYRPMSLAPPRVVRARHAFARASSRPVVKRLAPRVDSMPNGPLAGVFGRARIARASAPHVTSVWTSRPPARADGVDPAGRSGSTRSRAVPVARSRARANARPAFRIPARFDVRPALVMVSNARVARMPAEDALPTIDAHKRRH